MGGGMEGKDATLIDGVLREVWEESNGVFRPQDLAPRMNFYVYSPRSKYMIFIARSSARESKLVSRDFGSIEYHDGIRRRFDWIPMRSIFSSHSIGDGRVNFRLVNKHLLDYLMQVEEQEMCYGTWKPCMSINIHLSLIHI